jgi:hypothetical protein
MTFKEQKEQFARSLSDVEKNEIIEMYWNERQTFITMLNKVKRALANNKIDNDNCKKKMDHFIKDVVAFKKMNSDVYRIENKARAIGQIVSRLTSNTHNVSCLVSNIKSKYIVKE